MAQQSVNARLRGQPPVSSHKLCPRGHGVTAAPASELCALREAGCHDFKGTPPEFLTLGPIQLKKEAVRSWTQPNGLRPRVRVTYGASTSPQPLLDPLESVRGTSFSALPHVQKEPLVSEQRRVTGLFLLPRAGVSGSHAEARISAAVYFSSVSPEDQVGKRCLP